MVKASLSDFNGIKLDAAQKAGVNPDGSNDDYFNKPALWKWERAV